MVLDYGFFLEVIGWVGTLILVLSYLVKTRISLHIVALVSSVLKLYYCYEHAVWPLFANWAVLVFVHIYKIHMLILEKKRAENA
jgi:hypothetical protein